MQQGQELFVLFKKKVFIVRSKKIPAVGAGTKKAGVMPAHEECYHFSRFFSAFSICLMLFSGVGRSSGMVSPSSLMVCRFYCGAIMACMPFTSIFILAMLSFSGGTPGTLNLILLSTNPP